MTQRSENWKEFFIKVLTIFKVKIMKTTTLKKKFRNVMVITNSELCELCCCCCHFFSWITDDLRRYSEHSTVWKSISLYVDNYFEVGLLLSPGSRLKQSIFILTLYIFSVSRYRLKHSFSWSKHYKTNFREVWRGLARTTELRGLWRASPTLSHQSAPYLDICSAL